MAVNAFKWRLVWHTIPNDCHIIIRVNGVKIILNARHSKSNEIMKRRKKNYDKMNDFFLNFECTLKDVQ